MRDGSSVRDLMVEVGHSGVVSHMGLWVPVGFADRVGLGEALSDRRGSVRVGWVMVGVRCWFTQC